VAGRVDRPAWGGAPVGGRWVGRRAGTALGARVPVGGTGVPVGGGGDGVLVGATVLVGVPVGDSVGVTVGVRLGAPPS